MEVYGMSENTGPQTVSFPGQHKTGSTGRAMPGTEMMIFEPDQDGNGEICFRGRHVSKGCVYLRLSLCVLLQDTLHLTRRV